MSTTIPRRHRSSTAASALYENAQHAGELPALIANLTAAARIPALGDTGTTGTTRYPDLARLTAHVRKIREYLVGRGEGGAEAGRVKDDFRHLHGFQALIDTLRVFSGFYHPAARGQPEKNAIFDLLTAVLAVLTLVFRDHLGNRRYFHRRVEGGGWAALEQSIASIGFGGSESDVWSEAQLFGILLDFALDDKRVEAVCQAAIDNPTVAMEPVTTGDEDSEETACAEDTRVAQTVRRKLDEVVTASAAFKNPEIIPTIVDFWATTPRTPAVPVSPAALTVILAFSKIAAISSHNLVTLHASGILSTLIPFAFDLKTPLGAPERRAVEELVASLIALGVNSLDDTQYLIRRKSTAASDFLLNAIKASHDPAYIQFDLSLKGYASVELATLGRPFPPPSAIPGYTFTAWIRIDEFDPETHTTIFGAFDVSQTCFVLAYLEKDTRNFILQTSVTSSRPSVRFRSTVFQPGRWYHIAIVHRRPKTMSSSKATLYVDGEFAEQVKSQYPAQPPSVTASADSFASFASSSKLHPVQAFIGTPQDLSSRLGRDVISSRWSLASAHLIEDALSDDLVAVYYRLGPRYNGNFQDCLGSFQTYEASAALGMRNEMMHPGKDETSDIIRAIREKAGVLLPESRILLSVLPTAIMSSNGNGVQENGESQLLGGLNRVASNNLYQLTYNTGAPLSINAAVPSINDALVRPQGTAVLTGDPLVVVPLSIDETMWQLGGFAGITLKLVEEAQTKDDILRAVEILFHSIKNSWRNSEAMEREDGYAILGALLRGKLGAGTVIASNGHDPSAMSVEDRDQLGFQLLSLVLEFVGYNHTKPEDSFIINPLAYRILLVDFDTWRKTALITQNLYYKQFITFGVQSKFHEFNSRRLLRMRIVKRFLDALKAESFSPDVMPAFIEALTSLIKCNMTAEVLRSLALFITYAYHKPTIMGPKLSKNYGANGSRRPTVVTTVFDDREGKTPMLTKRQLGNRVLEMYADLLCEKGNTNNIRKFARTVTNKWLLHLWTVDDAEVAVYGSMILARLLVVHGTSYVSKFAGKTGGFSIMRFRLKRWWDIPIVWTICLSILFSHDVAEIDFEKPFDLFSLLEMFSHGRVAYPNVLPVITAMLSHGLKEVLHTQHDPESPLNEKGGGSSSEESLQPPKILGRRRSMSLNKELEYRRIQRPKRERLSEQVTVLHTSIRFFADLHSNSREFRDYALTSDYVKLLLAVLYPVIVSTDSVSPETELNSRDSALTFEGDDVEIRPISRISTMPTPIVRTSTVETLLPPSPNAPKVTPLRRGSSFILLTSKPSEHSPSTAKINLLMSPKKKIMSQSISNSLTEALLELIVVVFIDQVMVRKEFPGFGIFLRIPHGFREHQAYFESYILRNTISQLSNTIEFDKKSLWEPRVIQNMARFVLHMCEAVFEGWFLGGAEPLLDFTGNLLEYLQRPDIASIKSVRLCSQAITSIQTVFLRVVLLRLSELDDAQTTEEQALAFMNKLLYWQTVVLSADISGEHFLELICYQLYLKLVDRRQQIRLAAANIWRIILVQKPDETSEMLRQAMSNGHQALNTGFKMLMELDNETFVAWVDEHRIELDALFFGAMSHTWDEFVSSENDKNDESAKSRMARRRDRLKAWHGDELTEEDVLYRHELSSASWMKNIYTSEHLKHQRAQQDQQDHFTFISATFSKMDRELRRPCAVFYNEDGATTKWKLDRTEGRNRMRLRMLPDRAAVTYDYQPKRRTTDPLIATTTTTPPTNQPALAGPRLKLNTKLSSLHLDTGNGTPTIAPTPGGANLDGPADGADKPQEPAQNASQTPQDSVMPEEDFELVDAPNEPADPDEVYEDKNRKVMRSLQRGDQVQHVFNISRIIGLEACEGLLILGKDCLYLIDNVFQRTDGEIVNVSQAPKEERDPYLQMILGQKVVDPRKQAVRSDQESRSWKWSEVISISKRRFLFRDVAVEIFFTDGRSYLLTALTPLIRDNLFARLTSKTPHVSGASALPNPEDGWRLEALKVSEEAPATFGSKFGNIFNSSAWNPAMRRWAKGEISNFHYLMLVNTMAGRTFNDLTQYPVFPWVLADYTSDELDLKNPDSYRDLTKPMGAQNAFRQAEFIERYKTFADMGDANTPAFHYGTHYSSAMIVTSYLIRLQPFVQSYLLLQGGNFDHPDRLFYSIEKTWNSASRDNTTDVRELIPEFFYLPEFLTNSNGYNFGTRQGNGGTIDTVQLPPWAKGDPKIFIAKNREALESPYVSRHLHHWIDLVFGFKQRGEAAVDSVNVFHHLSYHGARDLDNIEDPVERLATIGIIHNFGQTPHQVFSKPHQNRDESRHKTKKLDTAAEGLTRLPFTLIENGERVASLIYSKKLDRLLCASSLKLNMPPSYDKYMEWGFADNSIRFTFAENKKPAGLFENLHQGQLSAVIFASSQLLITAGVDCVIAAHTIQTSLSKPVTLEPRASLFGHKKPVTTLAVSTSFSTLLSASSDGLCLLWDLNRLEFTRKLTSGRPVTCARINDVSGDIMLCRGQKVSLFTLNGELILEQNVCTPGGHDDLVHSCAFYEGAGNEWVARALVLTGHARGVVNVWRKAPVRGKWCLTLVKRLDHVDLRKKGDPGEGGAANGNGSGNRNIEAAMTCVTACPQVVYTGDEEGRVYEWDLVQRER